MGIRCPKCKKVTKTRQALSSHTIFYHSATVPIHKPTDDGSFEQVMLTRTPSGYLHCPVCDRKYACSASLQAHIKTSCIGKEKTKDCPYCSKTFRHLRFYNSHVDTKVCILAKERARLRAEANTNITLAPKMTKITKRGPPISKFKCPLCKSSFNSRTELQSHFEEECFEPPFGSQKGRFICFECSRCFESKKELDMHSYNYHQDEITVLVNKQDCVVTRNEYHKFDCPQCHLTCSFPTFLETHVYYFCGQTTIECPECADSFETILQLNTHINSHHAIPSIPHSRNATPELSSPMSSTLTSSSSSSLDDPIVSRKLKRVRFSCHSCLNTFESDDDMRDHIYSDTCTPKIAQFSKRKSQHGEYRRLKHVKIEI